MKQLFALFALILITASVHAQAPNKMSYQAVIRNSSNALVTGQRVGMRISILQGSTNDTGVYVETQTPITNANGLVSIEIGGGTVVAGNFSNINWANGPYFVKTETDPSGGTSYSISGTSQLLSVPYALYAANAGSAVGGFTHYIGEEYLGGVVFHLWKDNAGAEHGLVVNLNNQSNSSAWSNITSTEIGSTAQSTWDGSSNSTAILNQTGHTSSAAKLCNDLNVGGVTGWYLPSIDELSMLWQNRFNVNKTLSKLGGSATVLRTNATFWSSSELDALDSWYFYFISGYANANDKNDRLCVRAVRAF
jgi:hypothetical protein